MTRLDYPLATRRLEKTLTPVCPSYLRELVILSDGAVTTCCLDSKGLNALGNVNEKSLDEIWRANGTPWHQTNIEANRRGTPWSSAFCNTCFDMGSMVPFGVTRTDDPEAIRAFHDPTPPLPPNLVIEPTASCNYACWGCATGIGEIDRRKVLEMDIFRNHILPAIPRVHQVRLYDYGESFLHPHIVEMIRGLREANPRLHLDLSTNGVFMKPSICEALVEHQANYLTVSLHGGHTLQGMLNYARRGVDLDAIKANVQYLAKVKRDRGSKLPWIFVKALLFDWDDSRDEMEDFLEFGRELGADFTGWDVNMSDPRRSSKRVAPGTPAYQELQDRKLLLQNFYELPAWP